MNWLRILTLAVVTHLGHIVWAQSAHPTGLQSSASQDADYSLGQMVSVGVPDDLTVTSSKADPSQNATLIQASCFECSEDCVNALSGLSGAGCGQTWVKLTPYAWVSQVSGNATVHGNTMPVNVDYQDLWNLLENGEVRGAFMGHLEFGRDNWAMFVNADIVSADPSVQVRRLNIDTGVSLALLEMGGAVDVFNANESDPVHSPFRVQMLGGLRYYSVNTSAILSLPNINPVLQDSQGEQWVDLFVGMRAIAELKSGVDAFVRGDIGGFGIGSSSNHAWNMTAGVTTEFIWGSNLVLGYRVFDLDQSLHGGTGSPQGFGFDAVMHGPVLGLTFQF